MNKPNILLITIDAVRADMLGCYGRRPSPTPKLDQLSSQGLIFSQAITGGSWTQAAFPVLLTSTYASAYGGCLGPLNPDRPSPVEALSTYGYSTGGFSTSPLLSRKYGYARGFEHFQDLIPTESDPLLRRLKGGERVLRQPLTHKLGTLFNLRTRPARIYVSAAELTDAVSTWVGGVEKPFFAWAHYMDVHWPNHLPEDLVAAADIAQAWRDLAQQYEANWHGAETTPEQRQRYIWLYEKALAYTDQQVGRLVENLRRSGKLDNTLLVIASDHGEEFLERRHWGHFEVNLHDEILRVPLIIYGPGLLSPRSVDQQVRLLDVMPTLLDLCGCPLPDGMEGISLAPLWQPERPSDLPYPEFSISEMWRAARHIIAVRSEAFKYIWDSATPDQPQLFDLASDPGEQENIHVQQSAVSARMQAEVDRHLDHITQSAQGSPVSLPAHDAEIIRRLRDLGYVE